MSTQLIYYSLSGLDQLTIEFRNCVDILDRQRVFVQVARPILDKVYHVAQLESNKVCSVLQWVRHSPLDFRSKLFEAVLKVQPDRI